MFMSTLPNFNASTSIPCLKQVVRSCKSPAHQESLWWVEAGRQMARVLGDVTTEAKELAVKMGSGAADATAFISNLGEEWPLLGPVLTTLGAIRVVMEDVQDNKGRLARLDERCTFLTACVVVKVRQHHARGLDVTRVERCIEAAREIIDSCSRRGKVSTVFKASEVKHKIADLNKTIDSLMHDTGVAVIATVEEKVDGITARLVSLLRASQKNVLLKVCSICFAPTLNTSGLSKRFCLR